jgi:hypothetical protein
MHAIIELMTLVFSLTILATVLCVAGYFANKLIKTIQQSRFESKMNSAAALARARSQARQAHA